MYDFGFNSARCRVQTLGEIVIDIKPDSNTIKLNN